MTELPDNLPVEPLNLLLMLLVYGGFALLKWLFEQVINMRKHPDPVSQSPVSNEVGAALYKLAVLSEGHERQMERMMEILNALQMNMVLQTSNLTEMKTLAQDTNAQLREVRNRVITFRERK